MRTVTRDEIQKFFQCGQRKLARLICEEQEIDILCAARDHARDYGLLRTASFIQEEIDRRES